MRFPVLFALLVTLCVAAGACGAADRLPSGSDAAFEPKLERWSIWVPGGPIVSLGDPLTRNIPISSPFGPRMAFGSAHPFHAGVDFAARFGTPVQATADGWVMHAGPAGSYGNMVELAHGEGIVTRYAHLSHVLVVVGTRVRQGQEIGLSGSTGRSTGAHLHYEVRQDGQGIDPWSFAGSHIFEPQRARSFAGAVPRWDAWNAATPDRLPSADVLPSGNQADMSTAASRSASSAR